MFLGTQENASGGRMLSVTFTVGILTSFLTLFFVVSMAPFSTPLISQYGR